MKMWEWSCPCCGGKFESTVYTMEEIANYVGATIDCPDCGSTLKVTEDLTCIDFWKDFSEN